MNWYRWEANDLLITLHVQPGARHAGFAGLHGDALKVKVKAPPEGGRANREIVNHLADVFAVPRSAVSIQAGMAGRRKLVRVSAPTSLPSVPKLPPIERG